MLLVSVVAGMGRTAVFSNGLRCWDQLTTEVRVIP